jgi:hypothetical protein
LPFHQVSQQHDLTIRKFQRVVMNGGAVYIDLPEDRGFVVDDILAPRPQTGALNLVLSFFCVRPKRREGWQCR